MNSTIESPRLETLADLLHLHGDISPERLPWPQALGAATPEDVVRLAESSAKRACDLVDGVLIERARSFCGGVLATRLICELYNVIMPAKSGILTGSTGTFQLWPGRVRLPSIAYFPWDRLPDRKIPRDPIPVMLPDLVVEVLWQTNTSREMQRKREDYFKAGVRLVWIIDPETRTVQVFTQVDPPDATLTMEDQLTGGNVLPGFSLSLREYFGSLDGLDAPSA